MTNPPSEGAAPKPRPDLRALEPAPQAAPPLSVPDAPEAAAEAETGRAWSRARPRPDLRALESRPGPAEAVPAPPEDDAGAAEAPPPVLRTPRARAAAVRLAAARRAAARRAAARRQSVADAPAPPLVERPRRRAPALAAVVAPGAAPVPDVAPARPRGRHWGIALSFALLVLAPFAAVAGYLYTRAADQYHSEVAFSIRSEEQASAAAGLIGALASMGTGSASDADVLFEYVRSQGIVEEIDADLDLRAVYNRAEDDPVFTLGAEATIEDLLARWRGMTDVAFESATGIIHVRANAFTPEDATAIATAVLAKSSALVNDLSEQAREDAVRFAREELAEAEANLALERGRLSAFRRENRIVDPSGDVAGQSGLLNALQAELAQALVERDMLLSYADETDQRVLQADRRITAVEGRIEAERASLGVSGVEGALPDVVGRYEELLVDLEFANAAYTQALAGLGAARAEARRQSRYLAPHVRPTEAERALYPRRALLTGLAGLFLLLGWGALMLVYYNVRDNR